MKSCYLAIVVALCSTQLGIGSDLKLPATDENVPGQGTLRRHGWFQNLWEKRRSAWAKQVQQDQGALVFLVTPSLRVGVEISVKVSLK